MLALLVPGVGMGGSDEGAPAPAATAGGHGLGKPTGRHWQPYLVALLGVIFCGR